MVIHVPTNYYVNTGQLFLKKICLLVLFFQLFVLNGFGQQCVISTTNPSFESPNTGGGSEFHCDNSGFTNTTGDQCSCSDAFGVPGWITTATDHSIEMWKGAATDAVALTNTVGTPGQFMAADGAQFIELNACQTAGVYQDFDTPNPTVFIVRFSHRGRGGPGNNGFDVCQVSAGPTSGTLTGFITATDNRTAWGTYTTTYTVPFGQIKTRFLFGAITSASGSNGAGNFLDNIQFTANNSINGPGLVALSCTLDQAMVTAGGVSGSWSQDPGNPSVTTINLTPSDPNNTTIISGFALTGTYKYTWTTPYCSTQLTVTVANLSPVTPTISSNSPVCAGNSLTLSASTIPGVTYHWIGPSGFSSTLQNPVVSASANVNMSGSYTLTVLSPAGCQSSPATVTVLVTPSTITIASASSTINGGSSLTLVIGVPCSLTGGQTITLTPSGNAVSGTNYSGLPSQVFIPQGSSSVSFTINGLNNNVINGVNTLLIQASATNYVSGNATVTIVDITGNNPSNTIINIGTGTISESLSKTLVVGLTGTVKTYGPLTVTIVSDKIFPRNYTANDGRGAQSISGSTNFTVVIPANQNSVSVTILTFSDGNVGNNVFNLSGSVSATGFTINGGVLTVIDTDSGGVNGTGSTTLTISSGTVSETLSRVLNVSLPSTINVTTTPLTLTLVSNVAFPQNYTSNDGRGVQSISGSTSFTVVIPSNQHSVSFTIQTASDGNVGNNIFTLSGSPLSNYVFVSGTLTVVDTDGGGVNGTGSTTLTISSGTVSETLSTVLNISLPSTINVTNTPLTLTLVSNVVFPRNYTSNDGRGAQSISGSTSFTVVIQSNQHSVSFTIQTASDGNVGNNIFVLSGSPLSNYVFVSGTLTVVDTDGGGVNGTGSATLTISSGTVSETLSRVLNVSLPSTINVTTTPLTLTLVSNVAFPQNYTSNDGRGAQSISGSTSFTVVIPSNQHSVSFTIQTASDGNVGNNVFTLSGSPLANYVFLSGTLTVVDTDGGGLNGTGSTTLTISSGTVSETLSTVLNVSLPSTINVTTTPLTLTLVSNVAFPQNYTSNDGRGAQSISGSTSFTVVIPSNQHSVSFTIQTASDGNVGNNVFTLSGSPLANYVFLSGTLTVVDTDAGGVNGTGSTTLTISSGTVSETLSRVLNLSLPSTINVTTTPLTLTLVSNVAFPQNYTSNDGRGAQSISGSISFTVVIPSNQHSVSFTIQTASDGNVGNNVFTLTGSPLANYVFLSGTLTVVDTDGGGVNGTGSTTLTISSGTVSETLSRVLNLSLPSTINVTTTPLTLTLVSNVAFPQNYTSNDGRGSQSISGSTSFTVVIPSNQHSVSFTIQTASDGNVGNNIFVLSGSPLSNYVFVSGTLTVVDTDGGGVNGTGSTTLTISSGTVSETLSTVLNVSLPSTINVTTTPLTLTLLSNVAFPRNYTSNDGRGAQSISGSTSFTVVIPSNQHSVSFTIQTASDGNVGNNIFVLSGSPLANYTFISGTLTVVDTDGGGVNGTGSATLTISSGTVSETLSTVLNVSLPSTINVTTTPLTLTLVSNVAFPRNYTSNDGRGAQSISGSTSFTVVIPSNQHSVSFTIQTASDGNVGNNVFTLSGSPLANYVFLSGTLTVVDTDAGGVNGTGSTTLTISSGTVSETLSTVLNVSLPSTINVTTTPLTLTLVSNVAFPRNYTSNDGRGSQSISGSTSFTVVIPSNQHSVSFTIQTASDGNVGNNVFTLSGSPLANYTFISGTLTVVDTDGGGVNGTGSTTLTISSGTVSETLSTVLNVSLPSAINVTITPLTLTLVSNVAFPRNYTSNDGRGAQSISGSTSFTVVIPSNQHSVSFTIQTASDGNVGNNVFTLSGSPLPNYTFTSGTLTVVDTDGGGVNGTGSVTLTISSGTVSETLSTVLNVSLPSTINVTTTPLTLTLVSNVAFPRNYTSNDGRGVQSISGSTSFTVVIPSNQHSVSFTIQTASDGNVGNNIFVLSGSPLSNYVFVSGTLTVVDTDGGGVNGTGSTTLTISSGTVSETLSTVLNVSLPSTINVINTPLTLTLVSNVVFPRNYTSNDGRGAQSISGSTSFTVVIPSNQHSVSFTIQTASDGNVGNNIFVLSGSPLSNYTFISGTLTVVDTDGGGVNGTGSTTLTISSGTVSETLSRVLNVSLPSTINVTTTPLTLTLVSNVAFPQNYTSNDGRGAQSISGSTSFTVVIPSNQHSVSFTIQTASDGNVGNNVFTLSGSPLANYVFLSGTLTVVDTDAGGVNGTGSTTLTISSGTVSETLSTVLNVSLPSTINVTTTPLTLTLVSDVAFLQNYTSDDGRGVQSISGSTSFTVVIPSGQHSISFTIQTASDTNTPDNIFHLSGAFLAHYVFVTGTLTVINTDSKRTPVLSITSQSTTYVGGSFTASVSSTAVLSSGGVVTYSISGTGSGSATVNSSTGFITGYGAGQVVLQATSSGDSNYNSVFTTQVLTINKGTPTLSITSTTLTMVVGSTATVSAVSTPPLVGGVASTGGISYILLGIGSMSATLDATSGMLTGTGTGQVVVQVSQGSDVNYNSPLPISLTITINQGSQLLTLVSSSGSFSVSVGNSITITTNSSVVGGSTPSYSVSSGSVTINPVTGFATLVTGIGAGTVTLTSTVGANVNYLGASTSTVLSVIQLAPTNEFTIMPTVQTVSEGNSVSFTISRSISGNAVTLNLNLVGGQLSGTTFSASLGSNSVSFAPGDLNQTVVINTNNLFHAAGQYEFFTLSGQDASGPLNSFVRSATVTVLSSQLPTTNQFTLAPSSVQVLEGGSLSLTISRVSGGSTASISFTLTPGQVSGTTFGVSLLSSSVIFGANDLQKTIVINTTNSSHGIGEYEIFTLSGFDGTGGGNVLVSPSPRITVLSSQLPTTNQFTLAPSSVQVLEGGSLSLTISRVSGGSTASISFTLTPGQVSGTTFGVSLLSSSVIFGANDLQKTIVINTTNSSHGIGEYEIFTLSGIDGTGGGNVLVSPSPQITVLSSQLPTTNRFTLAPSSAQVLEGGSLSLTISRVSGGSTASISFTLTPGQVSGTTFGVSLLSSSVIFGANDLQKTIVINTTNSSHGIGDYEIFTLSGFDGTGGGNVLVSPSPQITVLSSQLPTTNRFTLAPSSVQVLEGGSLSLTISRVSVGSTASISFTLTPGQVSGTTFGVSLLSSSVIFGANDLQKTIVINTTNSSHGIGEYEIFTLSGFDGTGGGNALVSPSPQITVLSSQLPTTNQFTLAPSSAQVLEGGSLSLTISRVSGGSTASISFTLTPGQVSGTTFGVSLLSSSVIFGVNDLQKTIVINTTNSSHGIGEYEIFTLSGFDGTGGGNVLVSPSPQITVLSSQLPTTNRFTLAPSSVQVLEGGSLSLTISRVSVGSTASISFTLTPGQVSGTTFGVSLLSSSVIFGANDLQKTIVINTTNSSHGIGEYEIFTLSGFDGTGGGNVLVSPSPQITVLSSQLPTTNRFTLAPSSVQVLEGGSLSLTISRVSVGSTASISFTLTPGQVSGTTFGVSLLSSSVIFGANDLQKTIVINTTNSSHGIGDYEIFTLSGFDGTGGGNVLVSPSPQITVLSSQLPTTNRFTLAPSSAQVLEGGSLSLTISRVSVGSTASISFTLTPGQVSGTTFGVSLLSSSVIFGANDLQKTIVINTTNSSHGIGDYEIFTLSGFDGTGGGNVLVSPSPQITVLSSQLPTTNRFTLAPSSVQVLEGGSLSLTISRVSVGSTASISFTLTPGQVSGTTFGVSLLSSSVIFGANDLQKTIVINTTNSSHGIGDYEIFTLSGFDGTGGGNVLVSPSPQITVLSSQLPTTNRFTLAPSSVQVLEGGSLSLTISRVSVGSTASISFTLTPGQVSGTTFGVSLLSSSVIFGVNDLQKTIVINTTNSSHGIGDYEIFTLSGFDGTGGGNVLVSPSPQITVLSSQLPTTNRFTLAPSSVQVLEGGSLSLTISRVSGGSTASISFTLTPGQVSGTTFGASLLSSSVIFGANDLQKTIVINTTNSSHGIGEYEIFTLSGFDGTGGGNVLVSPSPQITVLSSQLPTTNRFTLAPSSVQVLEGGSLSLTISRVSGGSTASISFTLTPGQVSGTTFGVSLLSSSVIFGANDLQKTIVINTTNSSHGIGEYEIFTLSGFDGTGGGNVLVSPSPQITVLSSQLPTTNRFTLAPSSAQVLEGGSLSLTISRVSVGSTASISFTLTPGQVSGTTFGASLLSSSVIFGANDLQKTIVINTTNSSHGIGDYEIFTLSGFDGTGGGNVLVSPSPQITVLSSQLPTTNRFTLAPSSVQVLEGGSLSLTISRVSVGSTASISFTLTPGQVSGTTFGVSLLSSSVIFGVNDLQKTIVINTTNSSHGIGEYEIFTLSGVDGTGGGNVLVSPSPQITVLSSQLPTTNRFTLAPSSVQVLEGGSLSLTISRVSAGSTASISFTLTPGQVSGTTFGVSLLSSSVIFGANDLQKTIVINTTNSSHGVGEYEIFTLSGFDGTGGGNVLVSPLPQITVLSSQLPTTNRFTLAPSSAQVLEGGSLSLTISRVSVGSTASISFTLTPGQVSGTTFGASLLSSSVIFGANDLQKTIVINTTNSSHGIGDYEIFTLSGFDGTGGGNVLVSPSPQITVLSSQLPTTNRFTLAPSSVQVLEGGSLSLTISRVSVGSTASISFTLTPGQVSGTTFGVSLLSSSVIFGVNDLQKTIVINTTNSSHGIGEYEIFTLSGVDGTGGGNVLVSPSPQITVLSSQLPTTNRFTLAPSSVQVLEGGSLSLTISRVSAGSTASISFTLTPGQVSGTTFGVSLLSSSVIFGANDLQKTIVINTTNSSHGVGEYEIFTLSGFDGTGGGNVLVSPSPQITVLSSQLPTTNRFTLAPSSAQVLEGGSLSLTISRVSVGSTASISFTLTPGQVSGTTFGASLLSSSVIFGANDLQKTIVINTTNSSHGIGEYEIFTLSGFDGTGGGNVLVSPSPQITVLSSQLPTTNRFTLAPSSVQVLEGGSLSLTISRVSAGSTASISFTLTPGQVSGTTFGVSLLSSSVIFGVNDLQKTIVINTTNSSHGIGEYEIFTLSGFDGTGGGNVLVSPSPQITVLSSQLPTTNRFTLAPSSAQVLEGGSLSLTISRVSVGSTASISFTLTPGQVSGTTFGASLLSSSVIFGANDLQKTIVINTTNSSHGIGEYEIFTLSGFDGTGGGNVLVSPSPQITVLSSQLPTTNRFTIAPSQQQVMEGSSLILTISRASSGTSVVINLASQGLGVVPSTSSAFSISLGSTSVTFGSGDLSKSIVINTTSLPHGVGEYENFTLSGVDASGIGNSYVGSEEFEVIALANVVKINEPTTVAVGNTIAISTTRSVSSVQGGALSYTLSSTGSGSATIDVSLGTLTGVQVGTVLLTVTALGGNTYPASSATQTITITLGSQSLTITSVPLLTTVGSSISVTTFRSVVSTLEGGSLTYSLVGGSGLARVDSSGNLTGLGAGSLTLTVTALGNTNYYGPISASALVTIGKGTPTLSLTSTVTTMTAGTTMLVYGSSQAPLGGITPSSSLVYSLVSGGSNATINSQGLITAYGSGTIVVEVSQGGDANYYAPLPVTLTITINPGAQILSINSIDMMSLSSIISATATTTAGAGRGGLINFTLTPITGIATIDVNNNITATQEGEVLLTAMISGDSRYQPASVSQTITIVSLRMQASSSSVSEGSNTTMTLSLIPTGIFLPRDVIFNLSGSVANPEHYHLPPSVTLSGGQTSVDFEVDALSDTILFDSEPMVVTASNVYLNSVSSALTITDSTSNDASNRAISIGSGTIFQSETRQIIVSLPAGVTSVFPITVSLSINSASDLSLLAGSPAIDPVVVIPAGSNFGSFSVTASSNSDQPAHILVDGSSVSFTVNQGVITVINKKVGIVPGVSVNHDGINDCFIIANVDRFPDNSFNVANRQGIIVYSIKGYNNADRAFCGISNVGPAYRLPSGTYYYVFTFIDNTQDPNNTREEKFYSSFESKDQ